MNSKSILTGIALLCASNAFAVELVKDSKAVATVYVDAADLQEGAEKNPLKLVLTDLNYHLGKMSGATLKIVETTSPAEVKGKALVLGTLAAQMGAEPPKTRWQEAYRTVVNKERALIAGETPSATAYGVYGLLRDLGCDWVMPGVTGEVIPQRRTVKLEPKDETNEPEFGHRRFWYRGGPNIVSKEARVEYDEWTRRQRLLGSAMFRDDREGHLWDQLIKRYKERFDEEPEMLALVRQQDGTLKRSGPQFESTHPKVVELVAEDIQKLFEDRKWPKDKSVTLSIGPADGGGYSISAESMAASPSRQDPMMGGADSTDLVVKLANEVMEKLETEYPNLALSYYVYSVHADFPALHKPHARLNPIFAPISYSRLHSTSDPHSKSRAYYRSVLEQWGALAKEQGNRYMVYEYNWNLADNMLPFTRVQMLAEEIALYHQLGFQGFILESTKAWSINGAADYVAAQLMWDADQDWKGLLKEYCQKSFGAAAPMMESYYLRLADLQSRSGQEAGSYYAAPLIFNDDYVKEAQGDIDRALTQKVSPEERVRLEAAVYPHSVLRHYLAWHQAMTQFDFAKAQQSYDTILAEWKVEHEKNEQFVAGEVPGYMKGLMQASTTEALKYSSAPYQMIYRFPDALRTALDPTQNGERMNFASPAINDSGWIKTQTYGSTWDAQGLGFYRDGAVWYRVEVEVKKDLEGKAVGLFLGGFEDEARVWINGKPVGSSGIKFANPAVFDLTDGIQYGKSNLLAIQIVRNSNMNENLLGGLLRPSFVFTGPRVEVSEKRGDAEYRVLPGGEKEAIRK